MIRNLTPHALVLRGQDGQEVTVPPSGIVVRVAPIESLVGEIAMDGVAVPLIETMFGQIVGLPEPQEGTMYVVSSIVRAALPAGSRPDVLVPARLVRDAQGRVIAAAALSR